MLVPADAYSTTRKSKAARDPKGYRSASRKGMLAKTVKSLLIIGLSIYQYPN